MNDISEVRGVHIPLGNAKWAVVDSEGYEKVKGRSWHLSGRYVCSSNARGPDIRMHNLVLDTVPGKTVDHKDRNPFNNRTNNLRLATRGQQMCNRGPMKKASSVYQGVYFHQSHKKWRMQICIGTRRLNGHFNSEEEAARAYDEAAKKHHGEFAVLNFPNE